LDDYDEIVTMAMSIDGWMDGWMDGWLMWLLMMAALKQQHMPRITLKSDNKPPRAHVHRGQKQREDEGGRDRGRAKGQVLEELELELIQPHMAQKSMLRGEVGARVQVREGI